MTREEKLAIEHAKVSAAIKQADEFERILSTHHNCRRHFKWVRHHLWVSGWQQSGAPVTLKSRYQSVLLIPLFVAHDVSIITSPDTYPHHLLTARYRFGENPRAGQVHLRFLKEENRDPRSLLEEHAQALYANEEIVAWQRETFPMRSLNDIFQELNVTVC